MFIRHDGRTKLINVPVTTSTVMTTGSLVAYNTTTGLVVAATSGTAVVQLVGVARKTILTTDADYATARSILVEVPLDKNVEWEADTSSAVAADVGSEVDLTDASTVNRGAVAVKAVQIRAVPSATKVFVVLKLGGSY